MGPSSPAGSVATQDTRNSPGAVLGQPLPAASLAATTCLRQIEAEDCDFGSSKAVANSGALCRAKINKPKENGGYRLTRLFSPMQALRIVFEM